VNSELIPMPMHRRVPARLDLDTVLCLKTQRRLSADSTVQQAVFPPEILARNGFPSSTYVVPPAASSKSNHLNSYLFLEKKTAAQST